MYLLKDKVSNLFIQFHTAGMEVTCKEESVDSFWVRGLGMIWEGGERNCIL